MFSDNDLYWKSKVDSWKKIAKQFADSCELDGFGSVRDAHMGDLSQAMRDYHEEIDKEYTHGA
jgi:hypothetical protein